MAPTEKKSNCASKEIDYWKLKKHPTALNLSAILLVMETHRTSKTKLKLDTQQDINHCYGSLLDFVSISIYYFLNGHSDCKYSRIWIIYILVRFMTKSYFVKLIKIIKYAENRVESKLLITSGIEFSTISRKPYS